VFVCICMRMHMCVCIYICVFFLQWVLRALYRCSRHQCIGQVYTLHRCLFDTNVHICDTLAAGSAHMCICIYICVCVHMYMKAYVRLCYCLACLMSRCCDFLSVYGCAYICIYICVCMYACMCACAYVCMCIYVCLCICMHIHVYTHARKCTCALV